jgi:hypothetical protein
MGEIAFEQKLAYLKRLLAIYARFLHYYGIAEVTVKEKMIEVKYSGSKNNGYQFQCIEFPKEHLGRRIQHYKAKVKKMFAERQGNPYWK